MSIFLLSYLATNLTMYVLLLSFVVVAIILLYVAGFLFSFLLFYAKESIQEAGKPPVAGTVFHMLFYFDTIFDFLTDVARKHQTFRFVKPFRSEIFTTNPANIEHTLKNNFSKYIKGQSNCDVLRDLLGEGIFAVDGDKWRHQRKLASYEFSTKVLRDFSSSVFRTNGVKLAKMISTTAFSSAVFDIQKLLMKSTLDSIFKVGFGVDLNTLSSNSDELGSRFSTAFDDSNRIVFLRFFDVFWSLKRGFNIGQEAQLKRNIKVIDDFVFQLIHQKRVLMESRKEEDAKAAEEDDVLPDGFKVTKGDVVNYPAYAMGRMTYLWGEDAEDFRPERWLENGAFRPESPFKFLAFHAGPRTCLGKEFAYRQMKIFAAILLHFFKFKLKDDAMIITYRTMFTLHVADGLPLVAFRRFM